MELRIGFNLLSDGTILLHDNLVQAEGSLDWVGLLVHPLQLFESTALRLDTEVNGVSIDKSSWAEGNGLVGLKVINIPEHPPEEDLNEIPTDKDPEVVGGNVAETNGRGELTDETDGADHEAGQGQTLGTSGSLQSFSGDDTLQRSVGEGENDVEEVVECQGSLTLRLADGSGLSDRDGDGSIDCHSNSAGCCQF